MENDCPICFGACEASDAFELPECGHVFHANCIITWFRSGRGECPVCRDPGTCQQSSLSRFRLLQRFSKDRTCPKYLKLEMRRFKKLQSELGILTEERLEFKRTRVGSYDALEEELKSMNKGIARLERKIRRRMRQICSCKADHVVIPITKVVKKGAK